MQLTPEQRKQVRRARNAGDTSVTTRFTPEQADQWRAAVEEEMAGKEANIAQVRKIRAACEQPGFFGDVRRAIATARRPTDQLAEQVGVSPTELAGFRTGEVDLPPEALERLLDVLHLRLMREISQ